MSTAFSCSYPVPSLQVIVSPSPKHIFSVTYENLGATSLEDMSLISLGHLWTYQVNKAAEESGEGDFEKRQVKERVAIGKQGDESEGHEVVLEKQSAVDLGKPRGHR